MSFCLLYLQGSSFSARDLVRALLVSLSGGSAMPQQVRFCGSQGGHTGAFSCLGSPLIIHSCRLRSMSLLI